MSSEESGGQKDGRLGPRLWGLTLANKLPCCPAMLNRYDLYPPCPRSINWVQMGLRFFVICPDLLKFDVLPAQGNFKLIARFEVHLFGIGGSD